MVRDGVIAEHVAKATDLKATVEQLIEVACQNGGVDNVSVVIVETIYK
jgi:serine/threonine protein phosphatase PrpC